MRIVLLGAGAVGSRAARQLHATDGLEQLVVVDLNQRRAEGVATALGAPAVVDTWDASLLSDADAVVLAMPTGHRAVAEAALAHGVHVVSVTDDLDEARGLLALDAEARERALSVVVGAGFSPGLTCVLARHAAAGFDSIDEVHVAKAGTGGPACARQHHRALRTDGFEWRGTWIRRRSGSGRDLSWFPDPVGALDCYRASVPDPFLLVPAFPHVERSTARISATRRDRLTSRFPMLRPPHPEGMLGAVRVEVRGDLNGGREVKVLGAIDRPAVAAGCVAAVAALWATDGRLARPGAAGLAELVEEPLPFLHELADRGVRAAVFEGHAAVPG